MNASDIAAQEFPVVRKGYDQTEVRAFLLQLSNGHVDVPEDPTSIEAEACARATRLIEAAEQAAAEIRERAEAEAALIYATAELVRREAEFVHDEGVATASARATAAADQADRLLTEAESRADARLADAEHSARTRSAAILENAKQRLQRLLDAEAEVHIRLSAAFSSVNAPASLPLVREDDEMLDLAFAEFFASDVGHDESRAWILSDQAR